MQQIPTLELLRRVVRSAACTHCGKRPCHSELFGPLVVRPCETECTIFANLSKLAKIAHDDSGNRRAPVERRMREQICLNCHAHVSLGSDCERSVNRECPLSVHMLDLMEPLAQILANRSGKRKSKRLIVQNDSVQPHGVRVS